MKIRITIDNAVLTATLLENKTAEDFVTLLPLECRMNDLFGREKYGNLPKALSTDSMRQYTYQAGDIGYWSPGTDIAIYYKEDKERISNPGIILIGKIDTDIEAFNTDSTVTVRIESLD